MRVLTSFLKIAGLAICLVGGGVSAQTLPLPEPLISLNSERGAHLLLESEANRAYWPLSIQFVTQKNQAYCGVASLVMVLNALGVPAPSTPEFEPFKTFTQDNVLNDETEQILPKAVLARIGMTLDQIGAILTSYAVEADVRHAADMSLDEFRKLAVDALSTPNRYVIVNYLRRSIGQERGGHISPLAAYDADTDRFLILDVSRYKYPPVWVRADDLYAAMNTPDPDNENRTRGFVLVEAGR
ncbi:glutathione gamma-glutamylcysteinyltransferase [Microvirga sp. KLBC 81]|uniref:phytochelatin synthase family protein n=1 Tax=Microvirga sp. KLBC 81 TaxID=1862707 RepID=UPI000D51794B|nr:phytochelatin synthase family protein [Microvirga sp. KLBC 81]PVE20365.1 glutathione gamma-glutamylcysteinyltransferase [Microvirga sp. KLBC 81]